MSMFALNQFFLSECISFDSKCIISLQIEHFFNFLHIWPYIDPLCVSVGLSGIICNFRVLRSVDIDKIAIFGIWIPILE